MNAIFDQDIPQRMIAALLIRPNGPTGLQVMETEVPNLLPGDCLVRVHAAAITRDELDWSTDRLPAIPSYEFAGEVVATPKNGSRFNVGDQVFGLSSFKRNGAAAEFIAVSSEHLALKPNSLDYVQSAAVPLAALSAWQGLLIHGNLKTNQTVVIHGASGGVGSYAVQIAKEQGARVIATTSSGDPALISRLGADEVISGKFLALHDQISNVDLVFDTAGGERLANSHSYIRDGGILVSLATEPPQASNLERNIRVKYFVVKQNSSQLEDISNLIQSGKLLPIIDRIFQLRDARDAFEYLQGIHGAGKIVLEITK